jgi:DcuC family C4-dicarboxylate transporter
LILIIYSLAVIRHIAFLPFPAVIFLALYSLIQNIMLTFIELLIGVVVIVGVARYIIKGYSATGVLFVGGLTLLIVSALMGHKVLPGNTTSTGYTATDIVEYIKICS